ncbi:MAG: hypothetical protein MJY56_00555 [Bacteroidales bacterium]|nr:hypothetical protein [Bacteroidales bacterium]
MKINASLKWLALAATVLGLTLVSCNNKEPQDGPEENANDVILTTQAEVDAFQARKTMNSLTIKGEDITDISAISVTTIETLIIDNTGIEDLVNESFTSVNKELKIVNNAKLKSISNLGLKFCSAEVLIENNPLLDCIKGFQNLKKMSGNLTIKGNESLGADDGEAGDEYGFNVIKKLIDNQVLTVSQVTLSNNHPDAVTDASLIGCGGTGIPSYTIRNIGDLLAITKTECQDLKLLGADVDNEVWAAVKATGLKTVHGDLYAEGCNFSMCSNFFEHNGEGIVVEGGITFKNFVAYNENNKEMYINSDFVPTHIGGDLVLEKLWIHGWAGAGFNAVEEIDGDFIVKDCYTDNNCFGKLLKKVHGNVLIQGLLPGYNSGGKGPWNLDMGIEEIDGDVEILDNGWMCNLTGWTSLKKIGGKLTIKNNFYKGLENGEGNSWDSPTGWDLVQQWIYDGVVDYNKVECYMADGTKVEFKASAPKDVTITSMNDIDALTAPEGELLTVNNLTVKGSGVTDDVWAGIKTKIGTVQGDLVCEDAAFTMLSNFFPGADGKGVTVLGNITFKNIATASGQFLNSDNFPTVVPGDLTIENVNIHGWPGAGFNLVTEVKGDLTIKTAMMGNNACFCLLEKVGGDLTIDGPQADFNGNRVWNVSDWTIKEIGGNFSLLNNMFVNFDGFKGLTKIGGRLLVKGTEITDFAQVQTWIDNSVVKIDNVECYNGSNLVNFEDKSEPVVVIPDNASRFVGKNAILSLAQEGIAREDFEFLVLDGNGETIADSDMAGIKLGINNVQNLVVMNIKGWSMIELFISEAEFRVNPTGSMYFINCPDLSNINGLKWMTKINGDLVFEDCPKIAWNWGAGNCLNQVTEIAGNFIIDNSETALTGTTCLASLKKVGGDLKIMNCNNGFWDLDGMPLEEIGGNFAYINNSLVNSFKGFLGLTNIGGNLTVKGTAIEDFSQVETWKSNGVLKGTASY